MLRVGISLAVVAGLGQGAPASKAQPTAIVLPRLVIDAPMAPMPEGANEKNRLASRAWLVPLRRCHRGARSFCDGPRRVPRAEGPAAELITRFDLRSKQTYFGLMGGPAPEALLEAVSGEPSETLQWPVPDGFFGRRFGFVRRAAIADRLHKGVDIPAKRGAQVVAANDGLVIYADNRSRGYGNAIIVLHPDDTRTLYAHLSRAWVSLGEQVQRGQHIGDVGMSGMARATHLHFEYRVGARARNPARLFSGRPSHTEEREMMRAAGQRRSAQQAAQAEARARRERRQARRERYRQHLASL